MIEPRRRVGRPATGQTPVRTVRIGKVWDDARQTAADRGEKLGDVIERYLRRYVAAHHHDTGRSDHGGGEHQ